MPVPDVSTALGLVLYDTTPSQLVDRAYLDKVTKLAEASFPDGSIEAVQIESLAVIVAEIAYGLNRIPGAVLEALLTQAYLVARSPGVYPSMTVQFTAGAAGASIPAGTLVQVGAGDTAVVFATTAALTMIAGTTTATVTATGTTYTDAANGTAAGTPLTILSATTGVTAAQVSVAVAGGAGPEDSTAYLTRASNRIARLNDSLGLPSHFTSRALEDPAVARAYTVDNTLTDTLSTPTGVTATPSTTGGTLAAATYSYRVSAVNARGETLASTAVTAITTGTTGSVAVAWAAVSVPTGVDPVTGYRVYGRTGTVGLLTTTAAGTLSYTDTGAATPGAAVATANTTAVPAGSAPGFVTVAVLGPGGALVAAATKTALQNAMDAQAQGNLAPRVIDPTITNVNVTATVHVTAGSTLATVQAAVVAALQAYLAPSSWPWSATVRRNDLIAIMEGVTGVDYVNAGDPSVPAADVVLSGVAPLANAGTLTITALV